jgi:cytochrome b561
MILRILWSRTGRALHEILEEIHGVLAWTLAALVVIHIAASAYHFAVRKDDVLQRMAKPWTRR